MTPSGMFYGLIPPAIAFIGWYWPTRKETREALALERQP
jgi:cytochrome c oxidase subunit 1